MEMASCMSGALSGKARGLLARAPAHGFSRMDSGWPVFSPGDPERPESVCQHAQAQAAAARHPTQPHESHQVTSAILG